MNSDRPLLAYRRENGRIGIRNHVIILPLDDISNAACEAVGIRLCPLSRALTPEREGPRARPVIEAS